MNTATTKSGEVPVSVVPGSINNAVPTTAAAGLRSNPATGDHCRSAAITTGREETSYLLLRCL